MARGRVLWLGNVDARGACSLDWKAGRELGSEWELIYQVWGNYYLLKIEVECNS